jgi:adenylate cyclase
LNKKTGYYVTQYGQIPQFKAGLHMGKVTVVEVGDIKRDIAYHGDTLNTAARIQSVCNSYNKKFLASAYVFKKAELKKNLKTESMGLVMFKGKAEPVEIASVDRV